MRACPFQKRNKLNGCNVPTMILFEARGLRLFWVVRGGIELLRDSVPEAHITPKVLIDTLPRPERLETRRTSIRNDPGDGIGSQQTLKLLAVSIVLGRNALLSSKQSERPLQSCVPTSDEPSQVSLRWPAERCRNHGKGQPKHWREWRHS